MRSIPFLPALLISILWCVGVGAVAVAVAAEPHLPSRVWDLEDDERVDAALELLERGSDMERRWVAANARGLLRALDGDPDDPWVLTGMERLRDWIATEPDEFIVSGVLVGIVEFEEETSGSLFFQLLTSRSPNYRRRAVQHYIDRGEHPAAVPILEKMWTSEPRDWIHRDVLRALTSLGSKRHLDDFVAQTRGDDPGLAHLSLAALGNLEGRLVTETMIGLAGDADYRFRLQALSELARQPRSAEVVDALLRASHDPEDEVRRSAARILSDIRDDPRAGRRVLQIAGGDPSPDIRYQALRRLDGNDGEVRRILEDIVARPRTRETRLLHDYATRLMAPPPPSDPFLAKLMERQAAGEEIDWEAYGYRVRTVTFSCGGGTDRVSPGNPLAFRVLGDADRASVRCWEAPGVPADFRTHQRIPKHTWVTIQDYHDHYGDLWVELYGLRASGCWVRREQLGPVLEEGSPAPNTVEPRLRGEFDLFRHETGSGVFRALSSHGSVEFFDEEGDVRAVAVDVSVATDAVAALVEAYEATENGRDRMLYRLLQQVPRKLELEPELRTRLDALPYPGEETDLTGE